MKKQYVIFFILSLFSINSNSVTTLTKYNKEIPSHTKFIKTLIQVLNKNEETEPDIKLINGTKTNSVIDAYIITNRNDRDVGLLTLSERTNNSRSPIELSVYILPIFREMGYATNALIEAESIVKKDKKRTCSSARVGKHQKCNEISKKLLQKVKYQRESTVIAKGGVYELYAKQIP